MAALAGVLGIGGSALAQQTRPADDPGRRVEQQLRETERKLRELERAARERPGAARHELDQRTRDMIAQAQDRMRDEQERLRGLREGAPGEPGRPDAGWLGVELSPVPAAVAAQLDIKPETGIMVRNIFTESPADKAGLQRYDVIISVDGQPARNDILNFAERIRGKKPGDSVALNLYRGGKSMDVKLQVGEVPDRPLDRKYSEDPDVLLQRDYGLRGKIFRPGPQGGWMMEDLGAMPELRRFFGPIAPRPPATQPEGDLARRVDRQGRSVQVFLRPDGSIEVRREVVSKEPAGPPGAPGPAVLAQTHVYKNAEELRKADPEAADLLSSMREGGPGAAPGAPKPPLPPEGAQPPSPPSPFNAPPEPPKPPQGVQPPAPPMPPFAGPQGTPRHFRFTPPVEPRHGGPASRPEGIPAIPQPNDPRWHEFMGRFMQGPMKDAFAGGPAVRFDAQPDGSIVVHKRTREAELNMTFHNRQEFQQQAPELYKQFDELQREMIR
jgi:hypothetical protein